MCTGEGQYWALTVTAVACHAMRPHLLSLQGEGPSIFQCGSCPFESRNRTKILHHRQFHRPRGLAFKCPQCSYNVTRRHLLAQHIKVHVHQLIESLSNCRSALKNIESIAIEAFDVIVFGTLITQIHSYFKLPQLFY